VRFRSWPRLVAVSFGAIAAVDAAVLGWGALVAGGTSCTSTTAVNADLISGIQINTGILLGQLQCGADASADVYKYVAVVINNKGDIGGAGIFDCFADGVFANLPGTDAGTFNFVVWVYAYNEADYNKANESNALVNAVNELNGVTQIDGSVISVPANSVPDGGTAKHGYPAALSRICLAKATWTSTCSSMSQPGVEVSAYCGALQLEKPSSPSSCNLPLLLPDASLH
jgi:hypothetical protein